MEKKDFGERLRQIRTARGFTQKELSKRIQANTPQTIYSWEHGICYPDLDSLERLCSALDVNTAYLFNECSEDDLSQEERQLIEKYRKLDERARAMVGVLIDSQVQYCESPMTETEFSGQAIDTNGTLYVKSTDPYYAEAKANLKKLQKAYKDSHQSAEAVTRFLWRLGYKQINLANVSLILSGLRVPTKQLYDHIYAFLTFDYTISFPGLGEIFPAVKPE